MNSLKQPTILSSFSTDSVLTQGKFRRYQELLLKFNDSLKLVSKKDAKNLEIKHFLDALAPFYLGIIEDVPVKTLDFGSGGGLPGIPLKIYCPKLELSLLEQSARKSVFLEMTIRTLGLTNASVLSGEAKSFLPEYQEHFEVVLSRATGPLIVVLPLAFSFIKVKGKLIFYKGQEVEAELAANKQKIFDRGGSYQLFPYKLTAEESGRNLLVITREK